MHGLQRHHHGNVDTGQKKAPPRSRRWPCRSRYLRGSCREGCHPGLEHAPPETEWVLADNDQVNQGEDGELVEEDSGDYGDDEHCQLGHDESEIGYAQDLGANDATDTNRRNPDKEKEIMKHFSQG